MLTVTKAAAFACVLCLVAGPAFADSRPYYDWALYVLPGYSFESGSGVELEGNWYSSPNINPGGSGGTNINDILTGWDIHAHYEWAGRMNFRDDQYVNTTDATNPPPNLPSPADNKQGAYVHYAKNNTYGSSTGFVTIDSTADVATVNAETDYRLDAAVGTPLNAAKVDSARAYFKAGGAEIVYANTPHPASGNWADYTVDATIAQVSAQVGNGIRVSLRSRFVGLAGRTDHNEVNFDNVRLYEHRLAIEGDANLDELVDISDFFILKTNFDKTPPVYWAEGDFNDDNLVDISDFFILKTHFDEKYSDTVPGIGSMPRFTAIPPAGGGAAGAAPTPEPATIALLALGGLALLRRRRG